jgi:putative acetyltransferase
MIIREERVGDYATINQIVAEAFKEHPHSNQREHILVEALREADALTVALVAEKQGEIVGHVAFSPVKIDGEFQEWYGLGPVAVRPDRQREGIGRALIRDGLARLRSIKANGCVLLGEPEYYNRFGFNADPRLHLEGVPPEYFMALPFGETVPCGAVEYHPAFADA